MHWNNKYSPLVAAFIIPVDLMLFLLGLMTGIVHIISGDLHNVFIELSLSFFGIANLTVIFGLMKNKRKRIQHEYNRD